jgi:hypothetical protein
MHKSIALLRPQAAQRPHRDEPEPRQRLQSTSPEDRSTNPVDPLLAGLPPRKRFAAAWDRSTHAQRGAIVGDMAAHLAETRRSAESLSTLVGWVRASQWNSEAGDMAPQLITRLPQWPAGRGLEVHDRESGRIYGFGDTHRDQAPVRVLREREHYSALVNGQCVPVPGDGNCFFHAVAKALGWPDQGSSAALRLGLARYIEENPEEVAPWMVLKNFRDQPSAPRRIEEVSSSDTSKPLARIPPLPSAGAVQASEVRPAGRVRWKAEKHLRAAAALLELVETAGVNQRRNCGPRPLDNRQIQQCAVKHGLEKRALDGKITHRGKLSLVGHAILQQWQMKRDGGVYNRVDRNTLEELKAMAKHVPLSDEVIVRMALDRQISIHSLRLCIGVDGELKHRRCLVGSVHASFLGGAQRRKNTPITAAALDGILDELARGATLKSVCQKRNFSLRYAQELVKARSRTLTAEGRNMKYLEELDKKGIVQKRVTRDAVNELQAMARRKVLSEDDIFSFSREKNMPFLAFKSYVSPQGDITASGRTFLERHARGEGL